MPRQTGREDGKVRVIAIYRMLLRGKVMSTRQILDELQSHYGITVERKTIYHDIAAIDRIVPIKAIPGRRGGVLPLGCAGRKRGGIEVTDDNHPCATCLRWPECNGVDAERCPRCVDKKQ